jgi:dihydrofolate synthase/folylpolyglutamate synthase
MSPMRTGGPDCWSGGDVRALLPTGQAQTEAGVLRDYHRPPRLKEVRRTPAMTPLPNPSRVTSSLSAGREAADRGAVELWLDGRINHERTATPGHWGLERMRRLLELLDNPQHDLPVVHVAGTKGKGSTVAMLAAMLDASGYRVGRYMSPHVHQLEERIAVSGEQITAFELVSVWRPVRQAVEQMDADSATEGRRGPTWFEILTAMALLHFRRQQVDLAVLETGLGGRLDATNVCEPLLSVITSISLDHMRELGGTVPEIAREKAGIIKPHRPVLCGVRDRDARTVIEEVAAQQQAPLVMIDRDFAVEAALEPETADRFPRHLPRHRIRIAPSPTLRFQLPEDALGDNDVYELRMIGRHQAENAALAMAAAAVLHQSGYPVSWRGVRQALQTVQLPARIEQFGTQPRLIVDAAHNAASMQSLFQTLPAEVEQGGSRVLVFAASADKQLPEMLAAAAGWADQLVLTRYSTSVRAASLEELRGAATQAVPHLLPGCLEQADPLVATREACHRAGPGGMVCIAGSFFLAAEVRAMLLADPSHLAS